MIYRYKTTLCSLLESLKQLSLKPERLKDSLMLQECLIKKIMYIESRIRRARKQLKEMKQAFSEQRFNKHNATKIKNKLDAVEYCINDYQRLLCYFRTIGDGLAFLYIDKWNLKPFVFKEGPGFISGKKGLLFEKQCLRYASTHGVPAVLNDITNVLRYGDITLPKYGIPRVVELKSGHCRNQRIKRQADQIRMIQQYILNDEAAELPNYSRVGDNLSGKFKHVRRAVRTPDTNHMHKLNRLIADSSGCDMSYADVEDGVRYIVARQFSDKKATEYFGGYDVPIVFMLNASKCAWSAYYPFTLSIHDPKDVFGFMAGEYVLMVIVNLDYVVNFFSSKGYSVVVLNSPEFFLEVKCNDMRFMVSRHFFGRVAYEFLSLKWVLEQSLAMFEEAREKGSVSQIVSK